MPRALLRLAPSLVLLAAASGISTGQTRKATPSPHLQQADAAFKSGLAAFQQGDLTAAHKAFAQVVQLAPAIAAGHSAFGAVLLAEGEPAAARAELQTARKLDPADQPALLNLGIALSQTRDYAASIQDFHELIKLNPEPLLPDAAVAYATALAATAGSEAAKAVLRQSLNRAPADASLHDALGVLLAQQQRFPEAAADFRQAIAAEPDRPSAHFHLGSASLTQGDPAAAIPELQRACELQPGDPAYATQLGRALTAAGRDADAVSTLRRAAALAPATPAQALDATYALALALQASGETTESLALLRTVAAARPHDPATLTNLALALVQTGDASNAIPIYQRALQLSDNPTLREDLGVAFLQQSDLTHAIEQFHVGLKLDRANPQLHYDLGLAFKLKDDLAGAIPEFLEAERLAPTLPDPPYTLGVVYMQQGNFPAAATQLEAATTLKPDNGPAWEALGNVYKQSGQPAKAAIALRQAVILTPTQPSPHIVLATLLAESGDTPGAAAERKIAATLSRVAVNRQKSNFALDSGRLLLERNQLPEALAQMQAAIAADPTYPEAHRALAEVLDRQGKPAQATLERKKAAEFATGSDSKP